MRKSLISSIGAMQEIKRREDAIARGLCYAYFCSVNKLLGADFCCFYLQFKFFLSFGSWSCYRGEKLAAIFPHHSSRHCKWNTNPSAKATVCCIYNMAWYVNFKMLIIGTLYQSQSVCMLLTDYIVGLVSFFLDML